MDANAIYTVFFQRECEVILNKIIETIYDELEALKYIPLAPAEGAGVERITWRSLTSVGVAKIISDYATDIPSVEVYGAEQSMTVHQIAVSFGWAKHELEKAQRAGKSLLDWRSKAARLAMETKVNDMAWKGDAQYNIPGFINYPGITQHILALNEAGNSRKWVDKTEQEIADDINAMVDAIRNSTGQKENPDTILLPPKCYRLLTTHFIDQYKQKSLLQHLKECNPDITTWAPVNYLRDAGAGGVGRIMLYTNSSDKLEFHMPVPIANEAPERQGLRFSEILTADIGGTVVFMPQSVCYADGASDNT